jgi:hypothetical protein
MNKETIAAIISDRIMINEEGLVQNAEEVARMDRSARSVQPAAIEIRIDVGASPGGPSRPPGFSCTSPKTDAVAPDPADRFPPNISDVGRMQWGLVLASSHSDRVSALRACHSHRPMHL